MKTDTEQSGSVFCRKVPKITENDDNRHLTSGDNFRADTFTVILDSLSAALKRRKQSYRQGLMKSFKFSSNCDGTPRTRLVILQRILKRTTLWIWKKISLMKWFMN